MRGQQEDLLNLVSAVVFGAKAIAHAANVANQKFGINRLVIDDIGLECLLVLLH